jgi:hypothetical protein
MHSRIEKLGVVAISSHWAGMVMMGSRRFLLAVPACLAFLMPAAAAGDDLKSFVATYGCMVVEQFAAIHEQGDKSKSTNRYVILAMRHSPQRFAQCIFFDNDTMMLCEASSGRYGVPKGQLHNLEISSTGKSVLAELGFDEPEGVANYKREFALGQPPNLDSVAKLMLTVMYRVYGARLGNSMSLSAPMIAKGEIKLSSCKPVS